MTLSEKLGSRVFWRKLRNSHKKRFLCIRIYGPLKKIRKKEKSKLYIFLIVLLIKTMNMLLKLRKHLK